MPMSDHVDYCDSNPTRTNRTCLHLRVMAVCQLAHRCWAANSQAFVESQAQPEAIQACCLLLTGAGRQDQGHCCSSSIERFGAQGVGILIVDSLHLRVHGSLHGTPTLSKGLKMVKLWAHRGHQCCKHAALHAAASPHETCRSPHTNSKQLLTANVNLSSNSIVDGGIFLST